MRTNTRKFRLALNMLVLLPLVLAVFGAVSVWATTYRVDDDWQTGSPPYAEDTDGDTTFATIQAAINAASPGDTIIVAAGIYPEQLIINEKKAGLTIEGDGSYPMVQPTLGDCNKYDTVIKVLADYVTIRGLDISNANHHGIWDGSWTVGPSGLTVDDCKFHDIEHGIRSYGDGLTVTNCEFYHLGRTGVYASGYSAPAPLRMTVTNNWFHDFIPRWKENHAVHVKNDARVGEVSYNYISGMRIGIAYYYGGPRPGFGQIVFRHNTFD